MITFGPDVTSLFLQCISSLHMTSSKHDYANYDRFVPNFDMAYKTITRVSVPNLKSFGQKKIELRAKEVGEFSITLYGKMGWGVLLPTMMAAAI